MTDPYKTFASSLSDPVHMAESVTPDDGTNLTTACRALYVGQGGNLRVTLVGGSTVTLVAASNGWHPVRATRVWATGTTATDILSCT